MTIAGIGSLVSEASARRSFEFTNFRLGEVRGWRRAFNQANWVNVQHNWGSVEAGDTAALAMVPAGPEFVSVVALMDVDAGTQLADFYEREAGYHIRSTTYWDVAADGTAAVKTAQLATAHASTSCCKGQLACSEPLPLGCLDAAAP